VNELNEVASTNINHWVFTFGTIAYNYISLKGLDDDFILAEALQTTGVLQPMQYHTSMQVQAIGINTKATEN